MKTCENCGAHHDCCYASGRFCSSTCARGFSTKAKRKEINAKVSEKLRLDPKIVSERNTAKHAAYLREIEVTSILDMSRRTTAKILRRMELSCFTCGWYHKNVVGDIHHIIPRKDGGSDENSNLTYICPNCHRLAHSGCIKPAELVSIQDYLGDRWKDYYFINRDVIP
jgi:5-methylcytosine-specific restriction endonuclease McrA